MTNDEKIGIDKYTQTLSIFQRCKGCKGRTFIASKGMLDGRIQNIWVCKNCGLPKARKD